MSKEKLVSKEETKLIPGKGRYPIPAYKGPEPYIFLSYAHKNADKVLPEIDRLRKLGYHVWYDEGIAPGNEWTSEIASALEKAAFFLVMLSPEAAISENVQNEIYYAVEDKKPFLAVHLAETKLEGGVRLQIGTKQAILKYNMSDEEYVFKLVEALTRMGLKRSGNDTSAVTDVPVYQSTSAAVKTVQKQGIAAAAVILLLVITAMAVILPGKKRKKESSEYLDTNSIETTVSEAAETSYVSTQTDNISTENEISQSVTENNSAEQTTTETGQTSESDEELKEGIISKTGELYEGGIYYHIFEKHAEIYKYDPGLKYLKIPKEIRGVPVTVISSMNNMLLNEVALETVSIPEGVVEISNNAFANCRNLKKVKLPESLTKIDNMAFYYCTGLKEITIPDNVETIGYNSFLYCSSLESVKLSPRLRSIKDSAFCGCSALKKIFIPNSVRHVGENAFAFCSSLQEITIPDGISEIPTGMFAECDSLSNVTFSGKVNKIGVSAFAGCDALKTIVLPEGLTSIGDNAFQTCIALEEIVIPVGVSDIGENTFAYCDALRSVRLSEPLEQIGDKQFYCCDILKEVYIPASVKRISRGSFTGCYALTDVWYEGTEEEWLSIDSRSSELDEANIHFNSGSN